MALKDTAVCRGVIVPDSNGGVSGLEQLAMILLDGLMEMSR